MIRRFAGLTASATILALGFAAAPAVAAPTPGPDPAKLAAGTEKDPSTGRNRTHVVGPGEGVPAVFGVTNNGDAAVDGLVLQVRILNDLDFTDKYENCWYSVDNNQETAWCAFGDSLAPGASLATTGLGISTKDDARPENISSIIYMWVSERWADDRGGVEALAKQWAGQDTEPVRGTRSPLKLTEPSGPLGGLDGPLGFVGVTLESAAGEPSPSPSPAVTSTPAAPGDPTGGEAGGLPVTGAGTAAAAGFGGALLLAGAAAFLIARRRRTRFTA